ncbi:MAG TPA: M56 family metallopeptidase [Bryobacteraceae bacterium]|jgi:hypothetical protein|nr:M56 family metallopeptidase [Bryobacteraceae bacterium]
MEHSILEWSVRALLLVVGTGVVVSTLRLRGPSVRHRAWTAAMVAMLLLPVWTKWGLSVTAPVLPSLREQAAGLQIPLESVLPAAEEFRAAAGEPLRAVPRPAHPDWQQILSAIYLAGIAVMLARLIWGTLQVRSLRREKRPSEGFATSPLCATPVTIGWLRPVPLLPNDWQTWSAAKLDAVLIHEREHVRRLDPLVQWLALLNRCVFWFHPLAWWLERKLASLAEEACDQAVLAGGHAAHDYARYLIEMARSVHETGGRIEWAGAVEFSSGNLPRRIRRIMDTPPAVRMSRGKSVAAASLCGLTLVTFLACSVGRSPHSSAGPIAQPDRTERASTLQRQQARKFSDAEVSQAALSLTPSNAKELELDVKAHPDQPDQLLEIVRYYQSKNDPKALDALTLWFIEQQPGMRLNWGSRPAWDTIWDKDGYERARSLWTEQLKKSWDNPFVYMNAAEFLSGSDNELAEQILLEGQRRFPPSDRRWSGLHWEVFLARHYAWALTGSAGQLPQWQTAVLWDESDALPAQGSYAQKVRQKLSASKDTELLTRTVEQLQGNRPNLEFCRALIERAISIDPSDRAAHIERDSFQRFSLEMRAKTDPGSLSEKDRIVLLEAQLSLRRSEPKGAEVKAHELLTLASHDSKDPNYGTAVFQANLALGKVALKRGDKASALRHLLAASEAPPTEFLRYNMIDISLARSLVDVGEREGVATFLDRCAKFNSQDRRLSEWAVEIRQGFTPPPFRRAG